MINELITNGTVRHWSEYKLLQMETGHIYDVAVDAYPCPYTYEETDIQAEDNVEMEELLGIVLEVYSDIPRAKAIRMRELIERLAESLSDEDALTAPELLSAWDEAKTYAVGDRVRYGDKLYRCLTAHTAQTSWTPDAALPLWVRIDDPGVEFPDWVQPLGATDAYPLGAKVTYNGKHWESTYANNIWIPGTFGWNEVT